MQDAGCWNHEFQERSFESIVVIAKPRICVQVVAIFLVIASEAIGRVRPNVHLLTISA